MVRFKPYYLLNCLQSFITFIKTISSLFELAWLLHSDFICSATFHLGSGCIIHLMSEIHPYFEFYKKWSSSVLLKQTIAMRFFIVYSCIDNFISGWLSSLSCITFIVKRNQNQTKKMLNHHWKHEPSQIYKSKPFHKYKIWDRFHANFMKKIN